MDRTNRMPGSDTLDEIADKKNFFAELEKDSARTINYNALNRDIDTSATIDGIFGDSRFISGTRKADRDDEISFENESYTGIGIMESRSSENQLPSMSNRDHENGLLEKVALLDSLESTIGTKPAASHETDMQPIVEGTQGEEDEFDDVDGGHVGENSVTDGIQATDNTHRGTFKTGTGFGYTDTSREIEAYHNALKQVGLSTMDDTKQFSLKDSSTMAEKTPNGTSDTGVPGTGAFGLKGIAPRSKHVSIRTDLDYEKDESEKCGFDLLPVIVDHKEKDSPPLSSHQEQASAASIFNGGLDNSLSAEDEMHPFEGLPSNNGLSTFKHSTRSFVSSAPVPAKRTKKPSSNTMRKETTPDKNIKKIRYQDVRSSGYGQKNTSNTSLTGASKGPKAWSPAEVHREETKSFGSLQKKNMRKDSSHSRKENHLKSSIESFANYIQSQFTDSDGKTSNVLTKGDLNRVPLQEDQYLSSAQKLQITDKERNMIKELHDWQELWNEERKKLEKANAELARQEREFMRKIQQMKLDYDQQIFKLKQVNHELTAKLSNDKNDQVIKPYKFEGSLTTLKVEEKKEQAGGSDNMIMEQEKLLVGYQQENERLYTDMKRLQLSVKTSESRMFEENQKLRGELALLREQHNQRGVELKNKGLITSGLRHHYIATGTQTVSSDVDSKQENSSQHESGLTKHSNDTKRILDLERQVKEMEVIIRRKQQDSLPALIWGTSKSQDQRPKLASDRYLEAQIGKLEKKLEEKDEEAKKGLLELEQRYNQTKHKYEERIKQLESKLTQNSSRDQKLDKSDPHYPKGTSNAELELVRKNYEVKVSELKQELQNAQKEILMLNSKEKAETALRENTTQRPKHPGLTAGSKDDNGLIEVPNLPPPRSKVYEPTSFEEQPISDILRENENLKLELERAGLDVARQRLVTQKCMAEAERRERQMYEEGEAKISTVKEAHRIELQSFLAEQAFQHSASKMAELQSKLDTQLVINQHLKEQFAQTQVTCEKCSSQTARQLTLELQVKQLANSLEQARKALTPEMQRYEALVTKIEDMERKHTQREKDLQQVIQIGIETSNADLLEEVEKWKNIVDIKNKETEMFKGELDTILEVLKELQRQGVILPLKAPTVL